MVFLTQVFNLSEYFSLDSIVKVSYLDAILLYQSTGVIGSQNLASNIFNDMVVQTTATSFFLAPLLQSEFQELFSSVLVVAPELSFMINDFIYTYLKSSAFENSVVSVVDFYKSNLNGYAMPEFLYELMFSIYG
jgi:hypothetical protein